jgi:hypothetical protein
MEQKGESSSELQRKGRKGNVGSWYLDVLHQGLERESQTISRELIGVLRNDIFKQTCSMAKVRGTCKDKCLTL